MSLATGRKKRVSKRNKNSWRKHIDITDVEEFLEDKQLEERLGPSLATLTNDELFKVDTIHSANLSIKAKRLLKASKPLNCFTLLRSHTKVPDPIKRNRVRTKEERKNYFVKLNELKNRQNGILKLKEIDALRNRKLDQIRRQNLLKKGEFSEDIWSSNDHKIQNVMQEEWLTNNTKKHNLHGLGVSVQNVNKFITKKSGLPAIELPHPGMSYNPSFQAHQDLLTIVAQRESKIIKTEKHLHRCTTGMFEKVGSDKSHHNWIVEMSEGLPSKKGTNFKENENSDTEYKAINPPVENKKKTLKQRQKQKKHLELERKKTTNKKEKKKITDIHQLKVLHNHIDKLELEQKLKNDKRKQKFRLKKNKVKLLGPLKYEEPEVEFNMAQEISGNLKNMKVEGNLLIDRFKSMQKRNILAPTKQQVHKKPKVKRYVKPGHHEENWKKTVAH